MNKLKKIINLKNKIKNNYNGDQINEYLPTIFKLMEHISGLNVLEYSGLYNSGYRGFPDDKIKLKKLILDIEQYEKRQVFISFEHKQTKLANIFKEFIEEHGINVFMFPNNKSGDDFVNNINENLRNSDFFINFINKDYMESTYCQVEYFYSYIDIEDKLYLTLVDFKELGIKYPLTEVQYSDLYKLDLESFKHMIYKIFDSFEINHPVNSSIKYLYERVKKTEYSQ